jgi:hypothetical protein
MVESTDEHLNYFIYNLLYGIVYHFSPLDTIEGHFDIVCQEAVSTLNYPWKQNGENGIAL